MAQTLHLYVRNQNGYLVLDFTILHFHCVFIAPHCPNLSTYWVFLAHVFSCLEKWSFIYLTVQDLYDASAITP